MQFLELALSFIFGAVVGSFLNVVILRLPEGQSLTGRSHCPACGRVLPASDLVPLFSFIALGGKCRGCGKKISFRYPLIELLAGLLFALAAAYFAPISVFSVLVLAKICLILSCLLVIFVIDLEHYLILDSVLITGAAGVLLLDIAIAIAGRLPLFSRQSEIVLALAMAVFCALPFFLLWYVSKGQWMGFGDVKLAGFLGLALSWPQAGIALLAAVFLGGATGLLLLAIGKKTLKSKLPFGTFLSLGAAISLFYGPQLLHWYLSLLGFGG